MKNSRPKSVYIDDAGKPYAYSRGEAFFRDQVDHTCKSSEEHCHGREESPLRVEWAKRLDHYAMLLQKNLRKLPANLHDRVFDELFMFMGSAYAVGAYASETEMESFKETVQRSQAQLARNGKREPDQMRKQQLHKAVMAAAQKEGVVLAVSRECAERLRPLVLRSLPSNMRLSDDYPSVATIKGAISSIKAIKRGQVFKS